ncbi:potential E3 ubiquitin-protein ligase ariadne-2 isoform X2 [Periplaneta americana]|uniref:potential E3 ubiquitin-protein ligase ariadne-2 isoform X2 n=1 Tax=Periplaneta americana TaxID=6978 RepID=UPI0037E80FBA
MMSGEEYDSDMEYSDDDICYEDYYNNEEDYDAEQVDPSKTDPEYFVFDCLTVEEVERLLNESVEILSNTLQITPSLAKVLLHAHEWAIPDIIVKYRGDSCRLLVLSKIKPPHPPEPVASRHMRHQVCPVCVATQNIDRFNSLACGHLFCKDCWTMHFEVQIAQGISTGIGCMAQECEVLAPEDFVLTMLSRPSTRDKYQQFAFRDYVKSHPQLRFCPGPNCQVVVRAKEPWAKRAICNVCRTVFCFRCGTDYHAPTDCATIKKWLTKCADDSETANYISAHTKDWENHSKSLKLEEQTLQKIKTRINKKVMNASGTWIDWQYLLDAATLLAKCRYTLQYTYPYAYYMEPGPRKELFEYQQAQLEAEIENLSWKIERAETTDRGDLENQMDIAEKRRTTLLKDFLEV